MLVAVIVVHVATALALCMFILLHAGRGGGLSEMFGGGMGSGGSTIVEKNLDRMTVFAALLFLGTTVGMHFLLR